MIVFRDKGLSLSKPSEFLIMLQRIFLPVLLALGLMSCTGQSDATGEAGGEQPSAGADTWAIVACQQVGRITPATTPAMLSRWYGTAVKADSFCVESQCSPASVIYDGAEPMVMVVWDTDHPDHLQTVQILSPRISLPNGLRLGSTLGDIIQRNDGQEVQFSGFGWDYGGFVSGYGSGKLTKEMACTSLRIDIGQDTYQDIPAAQLDSLSGDRTVSSLQHVPPALQASIKITAIYLDFNP